jgi:hypothetical protein
MNPIRLVHSDVLHVAQSLFRISFQQFPRSGHADAGASCLERSVLMLLLVFVDELRGGHDRSIPRVVFSPDAIHDISRGGSVIPLQHDESHDKCSPQPIA